MHAWTNAHGMMTEVTRKAKGDGERPINIQRMYFLRVIEE